MLSNRTGFNLGLIFISFLVPTFLSTHANADVKDTGEKGAQIYCFMRQSGNKHEVSWNASYEVIKRQANSLFKTSPKHAAVMIVETVVEDPSSYKGCGSYLGDLFKTSQKDKAPKEDTDKQAENVSKEDRYSY